MVAFLLVVEELSGDKRVLGCVVSQKVCVAAMHILHNYGESLKV